MVGDSLARDVDGAIAAGLGAVWLNRFGSPRPADRLDLTEVSTLGDLPAAGAQRRGIVHGAMELPHRVQKPWGHELWYAVTDLYVGKILHIEAGHRISLQFHERKDESSYVLSGRLLLVRGPSADDLTEVEIGPGFVWRNVPGEVHTMEALESADVLEVSTPEVDDVVRLADTYGRATSPPA